MRLDCRTPVNVWYRNAIFIFCLLFGNTLIEAQENKTMYSEQQQFADPHWHENGCVACHSKKPDTQGLYLRESHVDTICSNCHDTELSLKYHHPSGINLPESMQSRMSQSFQQSAIKSKGEVTCSTCHDLTIQCQARNDQQHGLNPLFFREGPYRSRNAICYECHKETAYARLNPHDQINQSGEINQQICGVCHKKIEELKSANSIKDVTFNADDDLNTMCTGCHPWQPHPGGGFFFGSKRDQPPNHLVVPSKSVRDRMTRTEATNLIILPVEPKSGKIFCGTCHNPHAKGVMKNQKAIAGADSENRLRAQKICEQCHDL